MSGGSDAGWLPKSRLYGTSNHVFNKRHCHGNRRKTKLMVRTEYKQKF